MRLFLIALLVPAVASAQRKKEDQPIPYEEQTEDETHRRELPRRSESTVEIHEETTFEKKERERSLASDDDPNIGLSLELVAGVFLLESSRGQGVEPFALGGIRFTWEWARTLLFDELWREVFFADVTWFATSSFGPGGFGGTLKVYDNVNYHYFTVAQGFAYPLGKTPLAVYAQAGIGFNYQTSSVYIDQVQTDVAAVRLLAQYGLGLRARFLLVSPDQLREHGYRPVPAITARIELTRFRRAYMDDTLIGGSVGVTF